MVTALSYDDLIRDVKKNYEEYEERVIGIMWAHYGIETSNKIIHESYNYWDIDSGKGFDIYWPGYGAYLCPDDEDSQRVILKYERNGNRVYFDTAKFVEFKEKMRRVYKYDYKDRVQLMLVKCKNGILDLDHYFLIDLEENETNVEEIMKEVICEFKRKESFDSLKRKYMVRKVFRKVKGINLVDIISLCK